MVFFSMRSDLDTYFYAYFRHLPASIYAYFRHVRRLTRLPPKRHGGRRTGRGYIRICPAPGPHLWTPHTRRRRCAVRRTTRAGSARDLPYIPKCPVNALWGVFIFPYTRIPLHRKNAVQATQGALTGISGLALYRRRTWRRSLHFPFIPVSVNI